MRQWMAFVGLAAALQAGVGCCHCVMGKNDCLYDGQYVPIIKPHCAGELYTAPLAYKAPPPPSSVAPTPVEQLPPPKTSKPAPEQGR